MFRITHDRCTVTISSLPSYTMTQRFGVFSSPKRIEETNPSLLVTGCRFRTYPSQTSLRDRTSHVGETYSTPPASGRSTPLPMHRDDLAPSGHRFADDLEGQNDERLEGLTAKVKLLKDVSDHSRYGWFPSTIECPSPFRYPLGSGTK